MRAADPAVVAALQARELVARNYFWITAKDRDTGNPEDVGFWNDVGTVSASVVDGLTFSTVSRTFVGSGSLITVDKIPLVSDISVRRVVVTLSQIDESVAAAVRGYDVRNAPVQIYRGLFDPSTRSLVAPAFARFVGFVDRAPIETPPIGSEGSIKLECVSHSRELGRSNSDVRSDASQQLRHAGDRFYRYTVAAGDWDIFWGKTNGRMPTHHNNGGGN